jgi:hypothetical protein
MACPYEDFFTASQPTGKAARKMASVNTWILNPKS